ncbi:MAG TPA: c-type cytochrome [Candidatus Acidoferrales bacterium]|jgi:mono/diheme cytochrome c family protein
MKTRTIVLLLLLAIVLGAAAYAMLLVRRGFSARENPSAPEVFAARAIRSLSIPAAAKAAANPFQATPEILTEAREHFADHCATCHANDGSGKTEIGQNLYPKAPDMRLPETQNLTDGEIYHIIHDGVRLTGMPAWGEPDRDPDSWKLVLFIRHLPQLSREEEKDMERFNPTSEIEREEKQKEEEFLNGEDSPKKK